MLTFLKEIFTWWNGQTLGTRLKTIFFGKLVGEDELGNKYYQNNKGKPVSYTHLRAHET